MKKLLILPILATLTGCQLTNITKLNPMEEAQQSYACKEHGGVYQYYPVSGLVQCRSGVYIGRWLNEPLPEDYMPEAQYVQEKETSQ